VSKWANSLKVIAIVLAAGSAFPLTAEEPNQELLEMVVDLLDDPDKGMRALALERVRSEIPGEATTRRLAEQLPKLPAASQAELIGAFGDRQDAAARPVVLAALADGHDELIRVAAVGALGALGQAEDIPLFVRLIMDGSKAEQEAARASLIRLAGKNTTEALVAAMKEASPRVRTALMEILVARRDVAAAPSLLTAAIDGDATIRAAAMAALEHLAGPEHISGMLQGILKATSGSEREVAEKALAAASLRIGDADKRAVALIAALEKLSEDNQTALLPVLGRVGGQPALKKIEAVLSEPNPQRHEAAVRALCNWPDASIAPRLIELIEKDDHPNHQVMSLRALIRIAVLADGRGDDERLTLLQQAISLCKRDRERRLALERADAIRTVESLRFLLPYLEQPALAQQACESIVELAHHRGLREPNKTEFSDALDKVLNISNDATIRERAERYKRGQTWARPATQ
jgi:HEAT repeat protein